MCDDHKHPPLVPLANSFWTKSPVYVGQPPSQLLCTRPTEKLQLMVMRMGTIMILFLISFLTRMQGGVQVGVCKWARKKAMQGNKELQIAPQSFSNHHNEADSYNGKDDGREKLESESEMFVFGNEKKMEKMKVQFLKEDNAREQRVTDCLPE